jgi:hypothetical protein
MENRHGTERRKYPRVRTDDIVAIHQIDLGTQLAKAVDLGMGGIRCQVPANEFKVGDAIEVTFKVGGENATGIGRVIRATQVNLLVQEIAIEFLELGDDTAARFNDLGLAPGATEYED